MFRKHTATKKADASAKVRPVKRAKVDTKHSVGKGLTAHKVNAKPNAVEPQPVYVSAKGKGKERASTPVPRPKSKKVSANDSESTPFPPLPFTFKVIAGSYEKLLYGLEGTISAEDSDLEIHLKPIFIFPAHISCVRAVAASPHGGKWLATGSADEIVKVWDLRRRKEIGGLMQHEGSITHLEFPSRSHLLSASEDGTLCLFRARDWGVLRVLKGHKGRVNSVAVHPSGKVALSVGKDRMLRMWDLMRGKGSASTKLGKEGEVVRWSTDGSLFVVLSQSTIDMYTTDMTLIHSIAHPSRLHDVKFCKRVVGEGEVLLVAAEDKKLSIYDIPSKREQVPVIIAEMVGHTNRVKAVDTLSVALSPSAPRPSTTIVSTISSDGKIHIYDLAAVPTSSNEKIQITPVAEYDTKGTRLTCLALADGDIDTSSVSTGKRKRADDDGEEQSEDDAAWGSQQEDSHVDEGDAEVEDEE